MKRVLRRSGFAIAVSLGSLGVSVACTEDRTGFFILGNVAVESPQCVARAEGSSVLISAGILDVALKLDYQASLLVGSQLAPRGDKPNLRTETMITTITGAEVQLFDDTGSSVDEFTVPAAGVIMPDSSADPGFGIVTATLIPAATGRDLSNSVEDPLLPGVIRTRVAEITVFGKTIGGLDVETAPLSYVIRVCKGCLVDFPAAAFDPVAGCGSASDDVEEGPCRFGQDDSVDCRLCSASNDFCRFPGGVP